MGGIRVQNASRNTLRERDFVTKSLDLKDARPTHGAEPLTNQSRKRIAPLTWKPR